MLLLNGYRCDAEIGSPKRGWRSCHKKAKWEAQKTVAPYYSLHYCDRHRKRGEVPYFEITEIKEQSNG